MALYEKKVSCPKCGVAFTIWVPRGMSSFGIEAISICDSCWRTIQERTSEKEVIYGKDRPDKDD